MYNYRELNVLEYTLHLARRASATVIDGRKSWLLYLQVIEDVLGPNNEPEEQISIHAYETVYLPILPQPEYGCAAE
jgi:hypothetical protein